MRLCCPPWETSLFERYKCGYPNRIADMMQKLLFSFTTFLLSALPRTQARNLPRATTTQSIRAPGVQVTPAPLNIEDLRDGASSSLSVESVSDFSHVGCFYDYEDRIITPLFYGDNRMQPNLCRNVCSANKYPVFGVENGSECLCGSHVMKNALTAKKSDCSYACNGNSAVQCGGFWRVNVYVATSGPLVELLSSATEEESMHVL
jgi:hypothetical protein